MGYFDAVFRPITKLELWLFALFEGDMNGTLWKELFMIIIIDSGSSWTIIFSCMMVSTLSYNWCLRFSKKWYKTLLLRYSKRCITQLEYFILDVIRTFSKFCYICTFTFINSILKSRFHPFVTFWTRNCFINSS